MNVKFFIKNTEKGISLIGLCIIIFIIVFICAIIGSNLDRTGEIASKSKLTSKEDRSTYIPKCTHIAYTTLARNPDRYIGSDFQFTGEVIEVMESAGNNVDLRVNITPQTIWGETIYSDTIYVSFQYDGSTPGRILEKDIINIYGKCEGLYSYISIMGAQVTLPKINALYIDIK